MKTFLIVVDMQTDFVDGALGTAEAVAILPRVAEKIRAFDGDIFVTYDTHFENYLDTAEGRQLPVPHCMRDTAGWELHPAVAAALEGRAYTPVEKVTFGSVDLPHLIRQAAVDEPFSIELIGLCTDICVVSNALLLKANFPEMDIAVDATCCAGVTPATHQAALDTMRCCQIRIS
jgi:nicotinamidase-related amidase